MCHKIFIFLKKSFRKEKNILSWLAEQKETWHMSHNLLTPNLEGSSGILGTLEEIYEKGNIFFMK